MKDKNDWKGLECQTCDQVFDDEYAIDALYWMNSCHERLSGGKLWVCGKCNKIEQEKQKAAAKEAAKQNGGAFGSKAKE